MKRTIGLALAVCLAAAGCPSGDDDDDNIAAQYEGFWLLQSATFDPGTGPVTITRTSTPQSLRGDVRATATGTTSLALRARLIALQDSLLPNQGIGTSEVSVQLEGTVWVTTDQDDAVAVFDSTLDGDTLTLTLDATDSRNTPGNSPPLELIVARGDPWTTTSVGNWTLVSLTFPGPQTVNAGACFDQGNGTAITIVSDIVIDSDWMLSQAMTITAFSDVNCMTQVQQQVQNQVGFVEEETDSVLRTWAYTVETQASEMTEWTMTSTSNVTLTRTACEPQPDCETDAPLGVEIAPAS